MEYILGFFAVLWFLLFIGWRVDKASKEWKKIQEGKKNKEVK